MISLNYLTKFAGQAKFTKSRPNYQLWKRVATFRKEVSAGSYKITTYKYKWLKIYKIVLKCIKQAFHEVSKLAI